MPEETQLQDDLEQGGQPAPGDVPDAYQPGAHPEVDVSQDDGSKDTIAGFEGALAQLEERLKRDLQSRFDRLEYRVTQSGDSIRRAYEEQMRGLDERVKQARAQNIPVSDDLIRREQERIAAQFLAGSPPDGSIRDAQPGRTGGSTVDGDAVQYANEEYGRMVEEYGFDAEAFEGNLKQQWERVRRDPSPFKFVRETRQLFEQQKRANQGNPPSAARVAGTTASTGGPGSNLDALTEELAKLQQNPMRPGNWERMQEIEKEMEQVLPRR